MRVGDSSLFVYGKAAIGQNKEIMTELFENIYFSTFPCSQTRSPRKRQSYPIIEKVFSSRQLFAVVFTHQVASLIPSKELFINLRYKVIRHDPAIYLV